MIGDHPEYVYWALIVLVAMPLALFSRVSGVVVVVFVFNILAYHAGIPDAYGQAGAFIWGAVVAAVVAHNTPERAASILYLPLIAAALFQIGHPLAGWWAVYWLLMAQTALVSISVNWRQIGIAFRTWRHWRVIDRGLRFSLC